MRHSEKKSGVERDRLLGLRFFIEHRSGSRSDFFSSFTFIFSVYMLLCCNNLDYFCGEFHQGCLLEGERLLNNPLFYYFFPLPLPPTPGECWILSRGIASLLQLVLSHLVKDKGEVNLLLSKKKGKPPILCVYPKVANHHDVEDMHFSTMTMQIFKRTP